MEPGEADELQLLNVSTSNFMLHLWHFVAAYSVDDVRNDGGGGERNNDQEIEIDSSP